MKFRGHKSIVWRATMLFMAISVVNFLLMALVIGASVDRRSAHLDERFVLGKVELVRSIIKDWESAEDSEKIHRELSDAMIGNQDLAVRIVEYGSGFSFVSGKDAIPNSIFAGGIQSRELAFAPISWRYGDAEFRGAAGNLPTGRDGRWMHVVVAADTSHHVAFLHAFHVQLAAICLIALLMTGATSWMATKRGLSALRDMAAVAERISASRIQDRIRTDMVSDELVSLAGSFNAMLDRLSDSLRRLKEFSSDIAHELRTPINTLMTQTQVSLSKSRSNDQYRDLLHSNLEEYERLARMIADMLFLAKADNGLIAPRTEEVVISHELQALVEFHEPVASERGVALVHAGEACLAADRSMLRRAISNLIDNAIKHTQPGGVIVVCARVEGGDARISVSNPGDDIPSEVQARIFDRFYRGSDSRHRQNDDGAGLGLAICASIVQAHGGEVGVVSSGGMTEFNVRIPLQ